MEYNTQQQIIILKGIAQQILNMNVPSFSEVDKMFKAFDQTLVSIQTLNSLIENEKVAIIDLDQKLDLEHNALSWWRNSKAEQQYLISHYYSPNIEIDNIATDLIIKMYKAEVIKS